jgi:hypothetical protein
MGKNILVKLFKPGGLMLFNTYVQIVLVKYVSADIRRCFIVETVLAFSELWKENTTDNYHRKEKILTYLQNGQQV